jgi:hypothetical protein
METRAQRIALQTGTDIKVVEETLKAGAMGQSRFDLA